MRLPHAFRQTHVAKFVQKEHDFSEISYHEIHARGTGGSVRLTLERVMELMNDSVDGKHLVFGVGG